MIDPVKLLQEVRENHRLLDGCSRHEFKPLGPENQLGVRYQCSHCGGRVDAVALHWYRAGLAHGVRD